MANNFCRFLSNGYRIKSDGVALTYQPCCWFDKEISLLNNPNFDTQKQEISNISDWVPECNRCKRIEDSGAYGLRSPRLRSFEEIPNGDVPDNVPVWMEITIDTTCNAACIMCGPWHSTAWRAHEVQFMGKPKGAVPDLTDPLEWLEFIKAKFPLGSVKNVSFLGGEPFVSPVPSIFLNTLKSLHGSLSEVTVHFQTNGSVKPSDELLQLLTECFRVRIGFSVDGVGDIFEYQRYPLKWNKLQQTVDFIKAIELPQKTLSCAATLTPFNIWYYDSYQDWVRETFGDQLADNLRPNISIGHVALADAPRSLRHAVYEKFGVDHHVSRLLARTPIQDYKNCIQFVERLDTIRKTDWRKTFPDIVKFFDE